MNHDPVFTHFFFLFNHSTRRPSSYAITALIWLGFWLTSCSRQPLTDAPIDPNLSNSTVQQTPRPAVAPATALGTDAPPTSALCHEYKSDWTAADEINEDSPVYGFAVNLFPSNEKGALQHCMFDVFRFGIVMCKGTYKDTDYIDQSADGAFLAGAIEGFKVPGEGGSLVQATITSLGAGLKAQLEQSIKNVKAKNEKRSQSAEREQTHLLECLKDDMGFIDSSFIMNTRVECHKRIWETGGPVNGSCLVKYPQKSPEKSEGTSQQGDE